MNIYAKLQTRSIAPSHRRGAVTVLAAILCVVMLAMVAFSVDIGYLLATKEEMQRTADAAALAACWDYSKNLADGDDAASSELAARNTAEQYAFNNVVSKAGPAIDLNAANNAEGDLVFGYINDLYNPDASFNTSAAGLYNAVRVRVRKDANLNGEVPMFFANVLGHHSQSMHVTATAAMVRDIRGFQTPNNGVNIKILPFALDLDTYNEWMAGYADDDWSWNSEYKSIYPGEDGRLEVNLYPQGTGSPGNRGTVDIGSSNNSTNDIARQILQGISYQDMEHHNHSLAFDDEGKLYLNGDTGISAGIKDELAAIKGQPRIIPIFEEVNGPGNNAMYTIVKWMGVRIMDVKLTGPMSKKHVTIQACPVVTPGVIPSSEIGTSSYVYSPAILID